MQVPYIVEGADEGEVVLACANAEGGQLYPEEVSGQVLAHLLEHAQQSTGTTISKAVISVSGHCHKRCWTVNAPEAKFSALMPVCNKQSAAFTMDSTVAISPSMHAILFCFCFWLGLMQQCSTGRP